MGCPRGVRGICKVYIERGTSIDQSSAIDHGPFRVIAMELSSEFFRDPQLYEKLSTADQQTAALVDIRSKSNYGFATTEEQLRQQAAELNNNRLN